nr:DUF4846 domain-containing protein [uncultured Mucilaginibacter sp.]
MKQLIAFILSTCLGFAPADKVSTRFAPPAGYRQVAVAPGSFGAYLQNLPLLPPGTRTKTYKGNVADTDPYTAAVVDMSIGSQDLQQCADAVMRLRSEYLFQKQDYRAISFNFTSGFKCDFEHYANGYRYSNEHWVLKGKKDYSYANFMRYMTLVFSYAGTLSLQKELKPVTNADELRAGDVFIRGGSPGHCFIILDVAENAAHKKIFLLAQSFMPAQNIQVLQNDSPWFTLAQRANIPYGELIDAKYLKRF